MNDLYVLQADGGTLGNLPDWLGNALAEIVATLPRLVGALVILVVGWFIGKAVGKLIARVADGAGIDRRAGDTPLGRMMGDSRNAVSNFLGKVGAWFVYALAVLAAANALAIPVLSRWIATAVSYLPSLIAGLLVIIGGFVLADFVGDAIRRTRAATEAGYTRYVASAVQLFLYFTVLVIGLDTMGIAVDILYVFARAMAWGIAAGVALAIGISFGWGGHWYVADNVDRWTGRARSTASDISTQEQGSPADDD